MIGPNAIPEDVIETALEVADEANEAWKYGSGVNDDVRVIARAILAERERISSVIQKWKHRDHLELHAGETTAQEFRTVVAVLISIEAAIRTPTDKGNRT